MPNADEHRLHYPLADAVPAPGTVLEVAPGLRWVRMGLPFALDHVNLWLLRDRADDGREGWAVVDCGITSDATRNAWERVFAQGLDALPVLRVIVTHMHPDHIGLAHWLTERWGARLWISATDYHAARIGSQSTTGFGGDSAAAFFAAHGLIDPDAVAKVRARAGYYPSLVPAVPAQYRRLIDGLTLRIGDHHWRCIAGYGHAPEHIALHCAALGVLISGDMVLPRISTNVSVYDAEPEADPLPMYLASLERLRALPADTLVLPSHGRPFIGLHERIDQLRAHHDARLADTLTACRARPTSAHDLLPVLFHRALDLHQTTFAMGEAIAHLHALWCAGRLERRRGDDGIWRFAAA
ncbi:MBL fold metallo-hydrolase [Azohydromonas sp.]|uniref:MBL fold metallo-hydrolase n=1 Tax=Azohydromonas sp. TaxID=1872666 RepID=UPI002BE02B9F|nr:MBL fold metallo-hydrolase [Azohydromonas sp.]HMM87373.1 MBL fold metallo-hydrolase [Azohydromonas sp.]